MREAIRTTAPIGDLGFVDLVTTIVDGRETRRGADRAVDVHHAAADATNQMVMVVADSILEASRRPGGLDAPDESLGDQQAQGVVHRLERDRPDPGPDGLSHALGRDVRLAGDREQIGQALSGDLNAVLTKELRRICDHFGSSVGQILD